MMKNILIIAFCLTVKFLSGQNKPEEIKVEIPADNTKEIYEDFEVTEPANYEGGIANFRRQVEGVLIYPNKAKSKGTQGIVIVQFIVNKEGIIENIKIIKDIGDGCGDETIEAIKKIKKRWNPAKNKGGKPVKVRKTIPVAFKL